MVHAADLGVDAVDPRRHARQIAARIKRALGHLHRGGGGLRERLDTALAAAVRCDLEQLLLGQFDLRARVHVLAGVHRAIDQRPAHRHQRAEHGEVVDLLRELASADQPGAAARQPGQIGGAAQFLHPLVRVEHRAERHRGREHVVAAQCLDRGEDTAVQRFEEMRGFQPVDDVVRQPVVDHHRAQHRGLRLDVAGKLLLGGGGGGECEGGHIAASTRLPPPLKPGAAE